MFIKKLQKVIKRHPFLYLTRFRLLSRNSRPEDIVDYTYNDLNTKSDINDYFYGINLKIFDTRKPNSDMEVVKHIVTWLCQHTKVGPGLSAPSDKALETMLYGNGGVCSDMSQIFNNFCVINDIYVREWGTTSAPFNRANGGHSFNEVYIKELKKWLLIDPSWGMLFYNEQNMPLSVIEVYKMSRTDQNVFYKSFLKDKIIEASQVNKNYLNMDISPFLICEYSNRTYDNYLKFWKPYFPVFVIHFIIYMMGKSYHYKFPLDDYNKIFS